MLRLLDMLDKTCSACISSRLNSLRCAMVLNLQGFPGSTTSYNTTPALAFPKSIFQQIFRSQLRPSSFPGLEPLSLVWNLFPVTRFAARFDVEMVCSNVSISLPNTQRFLYSFGLAYNKPSNVSMYDLSTREMISLSDQEYEMPSRSTERNTDMRAKNEGL
jgi:hypothetical protein